MTRQTTRLYGNAFQYRVTGGWRVPEKMSPRKKERERETDKTSDVFEHVKKQFTFLADSVGMN